METPAIPAGHVPGRAHPDMADQRKAPVLAEDGDPLQAGVHEIAQGEIDHPGKAAKRDSRLGPVGGEHVQFVNAPPGKDHGQNLRFQFHGMPERKGEPASSSRRSFVTTITVRVEPVEPRSPCNYRHSTSSGRTGYCDCFAGTTCRLQVYYGEPDAKKQAQEGGREEKDFQEFTVGVWWSAASGSWWKNPASPPADSSAAPRLGPFPGVHPPNRAHGTSSPPAVRHFSCSRRSER